MPGVVPFGPMMVDWEERINFDRMRKERLAKTRKAMEKAKADALILVRWENARYTTSIRGHNWPNMFFGHVVAVIPKDDDPYVFYGDVEFPKKNSPWIPKSHILKACKMEYYEGSRSFAQACSKILGPKFKGRIGVDVWNGPMKEALPAELPGAEWIDGQEIMLDARFVKTKEEQLCMKMAVAIAEAAMQDVIDFVRPGVRECEIIGVAFKRFWDFGNEWTQCGTVVNSGPYGAPYRRFSGDRILQDGDIWLADIGCCWNGYYSDLTRSYICGRSKPTEEQKKLVREAYMGQKAAEKLIKAGMTIPQIMSQTPEAFSGHGLGIACFEKPYLMRETPENKVGDTRPLEVGTCIVLGAHTEKEGVGGIKMEDHAFVTETGLEVYSTFPRGPFVDAAMEGYE
jgi:Xaa-Pro aminopeptidase